MSPTGTAITDVREMLFTAAERVLQRDGPGGLTSRAVTDEAGCAKGVLHNHFGDLDGFLVEFIIDRRRRVADGFAHLRSEAGKGSVVGNLSTALTSLFGSTALELLNLSRSRAALVVRLRQAEPGARPLFSDVEATLAAYLDAEQQLGRVPAQADTRMLAFTLLGSIHHLFASEGGAALDRQRVHPIVQALLAGLAGSFPDTTRGKS